uniref:Autophagy-related protein 13 n=1 Tax=Glossina brevipalpis TaxID=37001 RepID=A0A1A9WMQ7_9MUSC
MSTTQRINAAEKDLEKFIKFLALKSTQVVVQSRLGEKMQTKCSPLAGNDWFNIVVEDHPDVYAETKRALALQPGETILQRLPLCIEISLKTSEGDQMILEVWSLDLQTPTQLRQKDNDKVEINGTNNATSAGSEQQCLKAAHAIYNRMGILLKSLISLTRATPAYKLSRRQCSDSYGIYYRIYVDRPQLHTLGEGHKSVRIGQLNTIVGNLVMSVAYRTKMTITPTTTAVQTRTRETNTIMIDSNHFRPSDATPKDKYTNGLNMKKGVGGVEGERKIIDIEKPLRPGPFTDVAKLRQYTEEDFILPETPPFEWLLRKPRHESTGSGGTGGSVESLNHKCDSPTTPPLGNNGHHHQQQQQQQHNINNKTNTNNNNGSSSNNAANNKNNAINSLKCVENNENSHQTIQQQKSPANSTHSQSPVKSLFVPVPPATRHSSAPHLPMHANHAAAAYSADDKNLLKELNFPFASPTSHVNDLAKFYRDCYHAPPLSGLSELQNETTTSTATTTATATTTTKATTSNTDGGNDDDDYDDDDDNNDAAITNCGGGGCGNDDNGAPVGDVSTVDDLSRQLAQFETSLEDYDKLVSQFATLTTSSSTGSRSSNGLQMSN